MLLLKILSATEGNEQRAKEKRYQTGSLFLRGKNPVWIGRYREDVIRDDGRVFRKRTSVVLGSKKEFPTKRLAEQRMEQVLARINAVGYRPGRVATLGDFIERWRTEVSLQTRAFIHPRCEVTS